MQTSEWRGCKCFVYFDWAIDLFVSKAGRGVDMERTLESLEGDLYGKVVKIMKRKCQGGKRVLE